SLVRTEQSVAVPLGDSADELLRNLLAATTQPNLTLTHLYPTVISGGVSRPASSEEILTVLDLRTPGSFTRTVETLSFGLYQDREPYIVMKVTNFDNAFSGTLTWEPFMSSDLSPLFGAPVTGTFNPQSRSATQVENPYFVDTVVANYDTRILRNERQEERLLYSFVNRNMLVITTSREALEQIADSLQ
ncbi:hypothetical protein KDA23_05235, partial [Candidatus Saccharibacteria bacterium]|nr:hypothetical protein [Candidatus Saccharibacteria bacterium]